jgi:hypothetical protein
MPLDECVGLPLDECVGLPLDECVGLPLDECVASRFRPNAAELRQSQGKSPDLLISL